MSENIANEQSDQTDLRSQFIYCCDIIKNYNRERYISNLFAPEQARMALMAADALNVELGSIAGKVNDNTLGTIRLQWWKEHIEAVYSSKISQQPILDILKTITNIIPIDNFLKIIDARINEFYQTEAFTMLALRKHFSALYATPLYISTKLINNQLISQENQTEIDNIYTIAGEILGWINVVKEINDKNQPSYLNIPKEIIQQNSAPNKRQIISDITNITEKKIAELKIIIDKNQIVKGSSAIKTALLPLCLSRNYFNKAKKIAYNKKNNTQQGLKLNPLYSQMKILYAAYSGNLF